jgi:hypothetical protein
MTQDCRPYTLQRWMQTTAHTMQCYSSLHILILVLYKRSNRDLHIFIVESPQRQRTGRSWEEKWSERSDEDLHESMNWKGKRNWHYNGCWQVVQGNQRTDFTSSFLYRSLGSATWTLGAVTVGHLTVLGYWNSKAGCACAGRHDLGSCWYCRHLLSCLSFPSNSWMLP